MIRKTSTEGDRLSAYVISREGAGLIELQPGFGSEMDLPTMATSIGVRIMEDDQHGVEDDLDVEPKTPIVDIIYVVIDPVL